MIKRFDHVGILVDDLEEAKRFVGSVLGLPLIREREVPERRRRTASFMCGEVEIELVMDLEPEQKARLLDRANARIEHIGIEVDDIQAAIKVLATQGVRLRGDTLLRGTRLNAWTDPVTTDGVVYQLMGDVDGKD